LIYWLKIIYQLNKKAPKWGLFYRINEELN